MSVNMVNNVDLAKIFDATNRLNRKMPANSRILAFKIDLLCLVLF